MGCHENHALDIAKLNIFFYVDKFLGMTGVPMNDSKPIKTCPGVAR